MTESSVFNSLVGGFVVDMMKFEASKLLHICMIEIKFNMYRNSSIAMSNFKMQHATYDVRTHKTTGAPLANLELWDYREKIVVHLPFPLMGKIVGIQQISSRFVGIRLPCLMLWQTYGITPCLKLGLKKSALKLGLWVSTSTKFWFSIHSKCDFTLFEIRIRDYAGFEIGIMGLQNPPYGGPNSNNIKWDMENKYKGMSTMVLWSRAETGLSIIVMW